MGSWGKGPFDNDDALDWLGDLADREGLSWEEEREEYAGQPDESQVLREMTRVLEHVLSDASHEEDGWLAYAALGLVAVALADPDQLVRSIAVDDRPFVNGVIYRSLLSRASAVALLPLAEPVMDALFNPNGDWYNLWFNSDGLDEWRAALSRLLGIHESTAGE